MTPKQKVLKVIERLQKVYPNPDVELDYENAFQLLISAMLSAQFTEVGVNKVTPQLFKHYPTPKKLASAPEEEIKTLIKTVRFHNNKATRIKECSQAIVDNFGGEVPDTLKGLDSLPGVARKTANMVLSCAFRKAEGIIVDVHMIRMSNRLGLSESKDPVKIEQDLMAIVPKEHWIDFPLMLILHGRHFCTARPHTCENCPLEELCPDGN